MLDGCFKVVNFLTGRGCLAFWVCLGASAAETAHTAVVIGLQCMAVEFWCVCVQFSVSPRLRQGCLLRLTRYSRCAKAVGVLAVTPGWVAPIVANAECKD